MSLYRWRKPGVKNCQKSTSKWPVINWLKIALKIDFPGGGRRGTKSSKIDLGGPGPQKRNFLKFCTFLQKLSTFGPPKSTPINDPIKMRFPTKTPVLLLRWGSKNVTFWGVGGRTARTEKCRHYYIAIFHFGGSILIKFYRFSTPATTARYM
jgi:hypothetical protein